jgi:outer membrane protein OmpA-like peptidoglycan-associated protein
MLLKIPLHSVLVFLFASSVFAQVFTPVPQRRRPVAEPELKEMKITEDEPGCKDSSLLSRVAGCSILQCDTKENETIEMQTGHSLESGIAKESLDGPAEVIYYLCPSRVSHTQIIKNAEANLTKSGYRVVYSGTDAEENPILTAVKEMQWIQVSTYVYNSSNAYIQTAVRAIPEEQANAESVVEEFTKTGRSTIYGQTFDEAALNPEMEKILTEIASMLQQHPEWKLRVEVFTDAPGEKELNLAHSKKSASAVARWLKQHGIDENRIVPQGLGEAKPVADTAGQDGRNKNCRINLVRL